MSVNDVFRRGDALRGFGEMNVAHLPVDLGAKLGGETVQPRGGDFLQIAFLDFLFDPLELPGEGLLTLVALTEDALGEGLGFGGTEVGDLELMLAAPLDEGGLGDFEFDRKAVEAPSLRAHEDEARDGFLVVHNGLLRVAQLMFDTSPRPSP